MGDNDMMQCVTKKKKSLFARKLKASNFKNKIKCSCGARQNSSVLKQEILIDANIK